MSIPYMNSTPLPPPLSITPTCRHSSSLPPVDHMSHCPWSRKVTTMAHGNVSNRAPRATLLDVFPRIPTTHQCRYLPPPHRSQTTDVPQKVPQLAWGPHTPTSACSVASREQRPQRQGRNRGPSREAFAAAVLCNSPARGSGTDATRSKKTQPVRKSGTFVTDAWPRPPAPTPP